MKESAEDLIALATEREEDRRFAEAACAFERAAAMAGDRETSAGLLRMAAGAHQKMRNTEDAVRCCTEAADLLEGAEKAECLMECFGLCITAIAGCEYDCGFEWRGAMDDSHSEDHDLYQEQIARYQEEAESLLRRALDIQGARKRAVLRLAKKEYERRKREGGWGAARCLEIISRV